jgi:hypothetical protein
LCIGFIGIPYGDALANASKEERLTAFSLLIPKLYACCDLIYKEQWNPKDACIEVCMRVSSSESSVFFLLQMTNTK